MPVTSPSGTDERRNRRVAMHARTIGRLRPEAKPVDWFDASTPGLALHITPAGSRTWYLFYRRGVARRVKLGTYPAVSLSQARILARNERSRIETKNADPAAERRQQREAETIADLCRDYIAHYAKPRKRTWEADDRMLNAEVLPQWKHRKIADIKRRDVRALVQGVADRGAGVTANRLCALLSKLFNWAIDQELVEANPATRIPRPTREQSRDRVLTDDELRRVWRLLSNLPSTADKPAPGRKRSAGAEDDPLCPVSPHMAALLKVRLLSAQRGGEVARMRWADVELGDKGGAWWSIPGADTKNGEPHRVWLATDAAEIVRALKPGEDDEPREFVFAARGASIEDRAKKAPAEIARALGIDFRGHDFRRTASTKMAEGGIPREHIAFVLNHVQDGPRATQVYDRYNRDREKQIALEAWARTLTVILDAKDGGKVLPFVAGTDAS